MKHDEPFGHRPPARSGDRGADRDVGAGSMAPGKRSGTAGLRPADPVTANLNTLRAAEAGLQAVMGQHLPAMRDATAARRMDDARRASGALVAALSAIDRQLASVRRWATVAGSDGALSLLEPLEAQRDAARAEAAPVLALTPPAAPAIPVSAAFLPVDEDWAAHDAAEAAHQTSWESRLDAQEAPAGQLIDASDRFVQRRGAGTADDPAHVQRVTSAGVAGTGGALPHLDAIQASFGPHDVSGVRAHVGGGAATAAGAIGAEAYATGNDVAFASSPSLFVAAHEAAHVVQQRAGVHLLGGVGVAGDRYEQHADAVAARVVAGESAAGLLGDVETGAGAGDVQRKEAPEDTFLLLQLDAVAARSGEALDRIDDFQDGNDSPSAAAQHVAITSEEALGEISDRLNNLAAVAPQASGKTLKRAARNAAESVAALLTAAETSGASVEIERGLASSTFAAFGIDLSSVRADAGHARFTSKERSRSITAALQAADARLSHSRKREPQADLEAVGAWLNQAELDLRDGKAKGVKKRIEKISATAFEYVAWTEKTAIPDGAKDALGMVMICLSGLRAHVGLSDVGGSGRARSKEGQRTPSDPAETASELIKQVSDGRGEEVDTPRANIEKIEKLLGLVWKAQARGVEQAGKVLDEKLDDQGHSSGVIEALVTAATSVAISGGAGALGEIVKTELKDRAGDVIRAAAADSMKEAFKLKAKEAVNSMKKGEAAVLGKKPRDPDGEPEPDPGTLQTALITPKNLYLSKQQSAVDLSAARGESAFADLRGQLEGADPAKLTTLREDLERLLVEGSSLYERLIIAQQHKTLIEWINFKARWFLGAEEDFEGDVDGEAKPIQHGGGALSLYGSPGLLDISAVFPEYHPDREPEMFRMTLHDLEPAVIEMLRNKHNGYTLGNLPVNRLLRLEVHDRTGDFMDTAVLVTASGQIQPKCSAGGLLIWRAFLKEERLVYLTGELDDLAAETPSLAEPLYAVLGARKFLEAWSDLTFEKLGSNPSRT